MTTQLCWYCHGKGEVFKDVPTGHPWFPCPACKEREEWSGKWLESLERTLNNHTCIQHNDTERKEAGNRPACPVCFADLQRRFDGVVNLHNDTLKKSGVLIRLIDLKKALEL